MKSILSPSGFMNSIYPCTTMLTFGPWVYMVPQYRPNSVLILGYGGGTAAGLIKMVYGDVPITGVDVEFFGNPYAVEFVEADAEKFIKTSEGYDVVVIDLWDDGNISECVTKESFVNDLKCNYIIANVKMDTDMSVYGDPFRTIELPWSNNKIYYIVKQKIPPMGCFGL